MIEFGAKFNAIWAIWGNFSQFTGTTLRHKNFEDFWATCICFHDMVGKRKGIGFSGRPRAN